MIINTVLKSNQADSDLLLLEKSPLIQLYHGREPTLVSVSLSVILCQDWRLTRFHHSPQSRLPPCTCNNRNQAGSSLYIFYNFLISWQVCISLKRRTKLFHQEKKRKPVLQIRDVYPGKKIPDPGFASSFTKLAEMWSGMGNVIRDVHPGSGSWLLPIPDPQHW